MEDELNLTYITLDGYVGLQKYRYLYFLIMFAVYMLILSCNSSIVYLILTKKALHEPMYVFIAALLPNSIIICSAMYPKLLVNFLSEKQIISYSACLLQFYIFYVVGPSEYLLLSGMAYDRYVSICKPLQYPTIMTKTTVNIILFFAWLIPASHIALLTILSAQAKLCHFTLPGIFCNNAIYRLQCVQSKVISVFGVVCLIDLAVLPMLFIVFTYTKIFVIAYRSCKEVRKKAVDTCLPHLLVLISFCILSVYDVTIARLESKFPKTARFIMMLQIILYHHLFNPLIYGLKMKEISKHFKRLFCPAKRF